jgi:glycosyltransferase involved in cell wall biosynthesis
MFTDDPELKDLQFKLKPYWSKSGYKLLYKDGRIILKAISLFMGFLRRVFHVWQARKYEYVLIHREASPIGPPVFEWLIAHILNKKIIFDFDDAIWLPNTSVSNKLASGLKWHSKFYSICEWSYRIAAGNEFLARKAEEFCNDVRLIPTIVDTENAHNPNRFSKQTHPLTIGWTGSHSTLPFIKPLLPVLEKIKQEIDFRLLIISNVEPDFSFPDLEFRRWNKETEAQDLMEFDIGIMPLPVNDWTRGKCGFKIIQYLAMGIPAVATEIPPNNSIIQDSENGFLCKTDLQWEKSLKIFLSDAEKRKSCGEAGRQHIIANYSKKSQLASFRLLFS